MSTIARQGSQTQIVRLNAVNAVRYCKSKDHVAEAAAIFNFVRANVRYVKDIDGIETLHTPPALLELRAGDCDDQAILTAALWLSIGIKAAFCALDQGKGFCHVWPVALIAKKAYHCDPTEGRPFGQTVPIRPQDKLLYEVI